MFTIEQLEQKVAEMAKQIEQSAANHHVLMGSKLTYDALLNEAKKMAEAALPKEAPVIEAVADAVEAVIDSGQPSS